MRLLCSILFVIFFTSCVSKYNAAHVDYEKFNDDVYFCLKKVCESKNRSISYDFSIISSSFAYGGGGVSASPKKSMSYRLLNLCLEKKGYTKDENGIFELPNLSCN